MISAHFGAYDYTASLGISAANQHLFHPACDFARFLMQARLAGTGVPISDGATNVLPCRFIAEKASTRLSAPKIARQCTAGGSYTSKMCGAPSTTGFIKVGTCIPRSWFSRYAAVYSFFLEGLDAASERLRHFIAQAAQATQVRGVFDDAATGQGLLNYFTRASSCGAIGESDVRGRTGLSADQLRAGSFATILNSRRNLE